MNIVRINAQVLAQCLTDKLTLSDDSEHVWKSPWARLGGGFSEEGVAGIWNYFVLAYKTENGQIMIPKYDSSEGDYSILRAEYDWNTLKIKCEDRGAHLTRLVPAMMERNDSEARIVGFGALKLLPFRLPAITKSSRKPLASMLGTPDEFGNEPGDGVILDSIIEYNCHTEKYVKSV